MHHQQNTQRMTTEDIIKQEQKTLFGSQCTGIWVFFDISQSSYETMGFAHSMWQKQKSPPNLLYSNILRLFIAVLWCSLVPLWIGSSLKNWDRLHSYWASTSWCYSNKAEKPHFTDGMHKDSIFIRINTNLWVNVTTLHIITTLLQVFLRVTERDLHFFTKSDQLKDGNRI